MPTRRSYTTYDVYRDYNSEDLLNDMYPLEGAMTPQLGDGCSPMNGHRTPSPLRPQSKTRPLGRPKSRYDVSVQGSPDMDFYNCPPIHTENKTRPVPSATQRDYAIPDTMPRPTSPVQRLLERYPSAPASSLREPLPGSEMDPITRQYYNRLWKKQSPSLSVNLNRHGRAGGVWRHVRACVANTGTQLAFIDGTVKQEDNIYFPPFGKNTARLAAPQYASYVTFRHPQRPRVSSAKGTFNNRFHAHAKEGFKYWYQEPKPIDLRGETTRIRARMVGNGY